MSVLILLDVSEDGCGRHAARAGKCMFATQISIGPVLDGVIPGWIRGIGGEGAPESFKERHAVTEWRGHGVWVFCTGDGHVLCVVDAC